MIAFTNGFTLFPNFRKFASYAGIAPFPYQSGISMGEIAGALLCKQEFKSLSAQSHHRNSVQSRDANVIAENQRGEKQDEHAKHHQEQSCSPYIAVVQRGTPYVDTMAYACNR